MTDYFHKTPWIWHALKEHTTALNVRSQEGLLWQTTIIKLPDLDIQNHEQKDYCNLLPSQNTLNMTCSGGASASRQLLWKRRILITSGFTGGTASPLTLSSEGAWLLWEIPFIYINTRHLYKTSARFLFVMFLLITDISWWQDDTAVNDSLP